MRADLRTEHVIRDVLVVAARDQDQLFGERAQTGNCSRRTGRDRIVVEADAVLDAHQLDAVLHAAEVVCDLDRILERNQTVGHADRRHIVRHVVCARDLDLVGAHNRAVLFVFGVPDDAVLQIDAVGNRTAHGELHQLDALLRDKGFRYLVIRIEHELAARLLVIENLCLCLNVFRHILVDIQMVRRDVGDQRSRRTAGHAHELE